MGDDWSSDLDVVEVPIDNRSLWYLGIVLFSVGAVFLGRVFYLNFLLSDAYRTRSEFNAHAYELTVAPRGLISDRSGRTLADNVGSFSLFLNAKEFLKGGALQEKTLQALENVLYLPRSEVLGLIQAASDEDFVRPVVLSEDLTQDQLVGLEGLNLASLAIESSFKRRYASGPVFAPILGYVGRTNSKDLKSAANLSSRDVVGRSGIEEFYDKELRGESGTIVKLKNAKGSTLLQSKMNEPRIGKSLRLTIDGEFQEYFYARLRDALRSLGRNVGVGMAMNPQNGEILAMVSLPSFDNNVLSVAGHRSEKEQVLNSEHKPLFNRFVSGLYTPGSTIKPLVGVAALHEKVIDPKKEIFSPGYLDVPNPYDPEHPTRFLDWRYQGNVDMSSAIAQSSNVYFYTVGGGALDVKGLGISKLEEWWQRFGLGKITGIDLPREESGFLPSPDWKERRTKKPWLLGDTYNVSIGQGDLLLTPIQLLNYITAFANGGKMYQPVVNLDAAHPNVLADLSSLKKEIDEVRKGMREAVTSPMGTAYKLNDLGFTIGAKTGSAQVKNNAQENALFVGFAPFDPSPHGRQIAILVLIENSLEGSLNAVPVAKDVLNWYYWNRISSNRE